MSAANVQLFLTTLRALKSEEHVTGSERGHHVIALITFILEQESERNGTVSEFAAYVCTCLSDILANIKHTHTLPSSIMSKMWGKFHEFRFNPTLHQYWALYLERVQVPQSIKQESTLVLQLLVDRLFKRIVKNEAQPVGSSQTAAPSNQPVVLTVREENAIRYMAGYVATKLKKKFQKRTKHPELQKKRNLFVQVLKSMEADHQMDGIECVGDYTTEWKELIDRGGLYKVKDEVSS